MELSRFRQSGAEQAQTQTALKLGEAIAAIATVIGQLRDVGKGQLGVAQVVALTLADLKKLTQDIRALGTDVTAVRSEQAAMDQKLDTIISNQATILSDLATLHPAA